MTLRWRRRGSFNGLVAFNKFLGMATKGFEEEILTLLNKIRTRKGQEGQAFSKRSKSAFSHFERELKKLECLVKYEGTKSEGERDIKVVRYRQETYEVKNFNLECKMGQW